MFFEDYFWKEGLPIGRGRNDKNGFKIASDPYKKRVVIEEYRDGRFFDSVYDSLLLNFRRIDARHQRAWEKEILEENESRVLELVRNENDQIACLEENFFENGIPRKCKIFSVCRVFLAENRLFYTSLGDPFSGVIMLDRREHPVILKKYKEENQRFTELLEERRNFSSGYTTFNCGNLEIGS